MSEESKRGGEDVGQKKIGIHPLAIASICDHYTRVIVGGSTLDRSDPTFGILFGVPNGQEVVIVDATDSIYSIQEGKVVWVFDEIEKKIKLWKEVYTNFEMVGWYTVGPQTEPTSDHLEIHQLMTQFNEAPLFLLMNSQPDPSSKHLPLGIYEAEMHMVSDKPTQVFMNLPFKMETSQTERVAVDQVTKVVPTDGVSTLEVQNQTMLTSLQMLEGKIDILVKALMAVQASGKIEQDQHNLLRRAAKICQQLPAVDSSEFQQNFVNELQDSLMLSYLGTATKTTASVTELAGISITLY